MHELAGWEWAATNLGDLKAGERGAYGADALWHESR